MKSPSPAALPDLQELTGLPPHSRRVFCNRTLNLRSIRAIGFDMDYTLIHYRTEIWEERAYEFTRKRLIDRGWPVQRLRFSPQAAALGLIIDLELGNIVKANRFGYIKRAAHGTTMLPFERQRHVYAQTYVDLADSRWVFVNSLFGLSEACLYAQLVDMLDAKAIRETLGYRDLYKVVRSSLDEVHMEGILKSEIIANPEAFVELDHELPLALLDLAHAGKKVLLITNSEWGYARAMMSYAFDRLLPTGTTWRDLFHTVIVGARKPSFFTQSNQLFEVVDEDEGLLKPVTGGLRHGAAYLGGNAARVEQHLRLASDEILYVGDHIFTDVHMTKQLRWRTALVVRELELDLAALETFHHEQRRLTGLMATKELLEHNFSQDRLKLQRLEKEYGPQPSETADELRARINAIRERLVVLDRAIAPAARRAAQLVNPSWGLLMRTGNDKSYFARQVERHADVYMSRVSNLLLHTPFVFLRAPGGSLPHDGQPADDPTLS